ncbi:MAG: excinuclease ABC subunit UvrB [bacterium]
MKKFKLVSQFKLSGDQPEAVKSIVDGLKAEERIQVLLGVTGSGKTFTVANVIKELNKPVLIISHNKILAAQLYAEFKSFFPENAVEYFISYYDYYQPEAYVPQSDTYIDKDASINEHIDRLRLKATSTLLERSDIIVVASVSCIYGLGSPQDYKDMCVYIEKGMKISRKSLLEQLISIQYERNDLDLSRGKFRAKGGVIDIFPSYMDKLIRVELPEDSVENISYVNPLTGEILEEHNKSFIYPARHFVTTQDKMNEALKSIEEELTDRLTFLKSKNKLLEAQRLEQRTRFDMEMMLETGFCHGIENYSRHLTGRAPGERPFCLIDFFPKDFLIFIDESHVTIPQINGMYQGDYARKKTLVDYGFRLPSALDNRPLKFNEFESLVSQMVCISATPGKYELQKVKGSVIEQVIRPTGLVDPEVDVRPIKGQIEDLINEIQKTITNKERVLVTTLTKKMAEDLAEYLSKKFKVQYLHSDIDALKRVDILNALRKGEFDVLVGINLLREGLDLPEVSLVAVLDADKEGFLRSETTLIQVCGRAARNVNGRVVLYADNITGSMKRAIDEMSRRRLKQLEYNNINNITPKTIEKEVQELEEFQYKAKHEVLSLIKDYGLPYALKGNMKSLLRDLEKQMREAADNLDFETAASIRDKIFQIREMMPRRKKADR